MQQDHRHPISYVLLSSIAEVAEDRLTKILTKTARPSVAINDARARDGCGRLGFATVRGGPRRSTAEPVG